MHPLFSQQLVALPFLIILLGAIVVWLAPKPKATILVLLIGSCFALVDAVLSQRIPRADFLVAARQDDPHLGVTRIFAKNLAGAIGANGPTVAIAPVRVATRRAAQQLLRDHPSTKAVLWGTQRWLRVSMRPTSPQSLASLLLPAVHLPDWLLDAQIVPGIDDVGLRLEKSGSSTLFLRDLLHGVFLGTNLASDARYIAALEGATSWSSGWSTRAHQAYPHLLLGNAYFTKAVRMSFNSSQMLGCAALAYRRGLALMQAQDNPPLYFGLRNNLAVLQILRWVRGDTEVSLDRARGLLAVKGAKGIGRSPGLNLVIKSMERNRRLIRGRGEQVDLDKRPA